jgi:hypothetical protein
MLLEGKAVDQIATAKVGFEEGVLGCDPEVIKLYPKMSDSRG